MGKVTGRPRELNAAFVLKIIRDHEPVTHDALQHYINVIFSDGKPDSILRHQLTEITGSLSETNLISCRLEGMIYTYTGKFEEVAKTLKISLSQLSAPNRIVTRPFFGDVDYNFGFADIFVLMPLHKNETDIFENEIQRAACSLNKSCGKGNSNFASRKIMEHVWKCIYHAELVICDCTGKNPNVYYELGIAHTLGTPAVLICESANDLAFDVTGISSVFYGTPEERRIFEAGLKLAIKDTIPESMPNFEEVNKDFLIRK